MTTPGFGKPKYGGGGNYSKNYKLQTGKNGESVSATYRILPPLKSCVENGIWAVYVGTHWGYKGVNPKDPNKPGARPFKCIEDEDFKTKMILQACPECDLIEQNEAQLKDMVDAEKKAGRSADEIEEICKPLKDWLFLHSRDRKWHLNVRTQGGDFGVLQISHKTKKKLDKRIADLLTEEGIDALDVDQGVWIKFTRTGKGIEADDVVDVETESVKDAATGRVSRTTKLAPLSEAEQQQALKECQDLTNTVRSLTFDQIQALTECSGEPEDVDEILAIGTRKETSPSARTRPAPSDPSAPAPQAQPAAPVAQVATPSAADTIAALQAQLAALQAAQQPIPVAAAPVASAPTQPAPAIPAVEAKPAPATPAATPAAGLPLDRAAFMARFKK